MRSALDGIASRRRNDGLAASSSVSAQTLVRAVSGKADASIGSGPITPHGSASNRLTVPCTRVTPSPLHLSSSKFAHPSFHRDAGMSFRKAEATADDQGVSP